MKKTILALLLCLFSTNVFCYYERCTGREWKTFNYNQKLVYVATFSEGYMVTTEGSEKYPYEYNFDDFIEALDKFYKKTQNKIYPVSFALHYIIFPALKNTWSDKQIEEETIELIKIYKEIFKQ